MTALLLGPGVEEGDGGDPDVCLLRLEQGVAGAVLVEVVVLDAGVSPRQVHKLLHFEDAIYLSG